MPGMNGDVVAAQMKAGQSDVPIALLSADDGLPESALRWVDAFVSKERVARKPPTDCRVFARSTSSICPSQWFNWRARKTRGIRHARLFRVLTGKRRSPGIGEFSIEHVRSSLDRRARTFVRKCSIIGAFGSCRQTHDLCAVVAHRCVVTPD